MNDERRTLSGATSDTDSSLIAHRSSLGDSYSRLVLAELDRANLFLVPLDDERRWYRYHLFAEVLRVRLRRGASAGELARLHQRASAWFEQAELIGEAVRYAFLADDAESAAALIERHAMALIFGRGEVLLVRTWVEQLPGTLFAARPRLALIHGWMLALSGQFADVEQLLANAAMALNAPDLPVDVVGELAALRSTVARLQGDSAGTLALAQRALDHLPADRQAMRAGAALNSGVAYLQRGDTAAARQALAAASTLAAADGSQWIALAALEELASLEFRQGQLTKALQTCERAVQMAARYGARPIPVAGMAYVGIGEVLCEWGDLGGATQALTHGIELLQGSTEQMLLARGYTALALVQQARGDGAGALATIQRGEDWFAQIRLSGVIARPWLAAQRARLWIQQGDLIAAGGWARACTFVGDSELDYMQQLTLVRLRLAQGQQDTSGPFLGAAHGMLASLLPAVEARGWGRYVIEILMLKALVYQAQASQTDALDAIERALALAEPERYARVFVDAGRPMQELLLALRQRPSAQRFAAYIDRLLSAFGELRIENEELRKTPVSNSQFSILNFWLNR
jgi:ATP/maltotriose-dependent transcriptional regulator MalT